MTDTTVTNEARPRRRTVRSIVAVVVGFIAVAILSIATDAVLHAAGVFPPLGQPASDASLLLATVYRTVYTVVGGYLTAWLAPDRPMRHVWILAFIGCAAALAGAIATWNAGPAFGPHWYPVALVVLAIPSVWAGGMIHRAFGPK